MISQLFWLCLFSLFSYSTFGLWICSFVLLSAILSLIGFSTMLYSGQEINIDMSNIDFFVKCNKGSQSSSPAGISKIVQQVKHPLKQSKSDQRLTGSTKIDEPLQEIMNYILRDYIRSWYDEMSTNEEFVNNIRELFQKIINNIAHSTKEVDWVTFLTSRMVDDFASHLRLYRQAEMVFKKVHKEDLQQYPSIESIFFDLETSMEKNLCRDVVCTSEEYEKRYLQYLSDVLLYLLLPPEDFHNKILRYFLREVLVNSVLLPVISLFSDPDYINQNLIWLCKDNAVTSKGFLTVIRRTEFSDELLAIDEIIKHEQKVQQSKDTGDKDEMKQHIKSLTFVQNIVKKNFQRLQECSSDREQVELTTDIDWKSLTGMECGIKLFSLPFDIVLNNNVGLHYFTEFMSNLGAQGYVFFYHSIEGFRASAEMILSEVSSSSSLSDEYPEIEKLRDFALHIFDAYLGEKAGVRVKIDETLLNKLLSRIKTEKLTETFFDEIQAKVYDIMLEDFYNVGFKDSPYYIKLLAELDLLQDPSSKSDYDESLSETRSTDDKMFDTISLISSEHEEITELLNPEGPHSELCLPQMLTLDNDECDKEDGILYAEIYSTGITHHAGKTFAVYAIAVSYHRPEGPEEKWFVVRRYSDFYEFHENVLEKYPHLSILHFPSKKTFNNLSRHLMEKRRHSLNDYLQNLLSVDVLASCPYLKSMLYSFLEPKVCEKGKKSFIRTVGTLVSPIKTSVKTVGNIVKLVPDTLFGLKDELVKVLAKAPSSENLDSHCLETDKVSAGLNIEADDIPLRIMLLLMNEVFDLKNKDLWFRRRIVALLRQIIKTTYGDTINRKIIDYVKAMTSAQQVAEWLKIFSQTFWPNGIVPQSQPEREHNTKMRTRVAAKTLLLCSITDELKHIIGSETTCKGAMVIFSMFQHPSLNHRLLYVLLENCLQVIFPNNNFPELFFKLHSESPRVTSVTAATEQQEQNQALQTDSLPQVTPVGSPEKSSSYKKLRLSLKSKNRHEDKNSDLNKGKIKSPNKLNFLCVSRQDSTDSLPKPSKKKKSAVKTAIFYTDCEKLSIPEDVLATAQDSSR